MSSHAKRRAHDGLNQHTTVGDKRPRRQQKHLYLVLDDWDRGFSVHKIDARHLPSPPALRVASPIGAAPQTGVSFDAMDTKIFALMSHRCGLVYDVDTAVLELGAHAPSHMVCGFGVTVAMGHFDGELDAWVGLHRDGSICACRVVVASPSCHATVTSPPELDCKTTKEKLFRNDDTEMHMRATLTYLGSSRQVVCEIEPSCEWLKDVQGRNRKCYLYVLAYEEGGQSVEQNDNAEVAASSECRLRSLMLIHKIDLDNQDNDDGHLPEPPALRLELPVGDDDMSDTSFAALGTKMFAFTNHRCSLVYNVDTAALSIGAHACPHRHAWPAAAPASS
ncbi:hypothetical protein HU200_028367 [Digitaria exilis]|uniref:Uncharacterized protein n=1 Tax=Digitaria exilis TaxID=1010633 RepID=A0A835BU47_9POAL|nr:hypothetical protein HU200_028367 [Digitaria exilis]